MVRLEISTVLMNTSLDVKQAQDYKMPKAHPHQQHIQETFQELHNTMNKI